jgi:hypothetical protein
MWVIQHKSNFGDRSNKSPFCHRSKLVKDKSISHPSIHWHLVTLSRPTCPGRRHWRSQLGLRRSADNVDGVGNVCYPFLTSVLRKSLLFLKPMVHHDSAHRKFAQSTEQHKTAFLYCVVQKSRVNFTTVNCTEQHFWNVQNSCFMYRPALDSPREMHRTAVLCI